MNKNQTTQKYTDKKLKSSWGQILFSICFQTLFWGDIIILGHIHTYTIECLSFCFFLYSYVNRIILLECFVIRTFLVNKVSLILFLKLFNSNHTALVSSTILELNLMLH